MQFRKLLSITFLMAGALLPLCAQSYDDLVAQARKQVEAARFADAVGIAQRAIALDKARWEAYLVDGLAENEQKHFDPAVSAFSQAMAFAPADKKSGIQDLLEKAILAKNNGGAPGAGAPMAPPPPAAPLRPAPDAAAGEWQLCVNPNAFNWEGRTIGLAMQAPAHAKPCYALHLDGSGGVTGKGVKNGTWRFDSGQIAVEWDSGRNHIRFAGPWKDSGRIAGDLESPGAPTPTRGAAPQQRRALLERTEGYPGRGFGAPPTRSK